jgi:hypothetical protein
MSAPTQHHSVFSGALRWGIRASGQFSTDVVIHSEPGRPSLHQDHSVRFALPTSGVSTASEPRAGHGARDAWIASHRPEDPRSRARGMQLSRVSPSWSCLTNARRTGPRPAALGSRRRVLRAVPGVRRHREILQSSSTIRMPGASGVHSAGAAPRAMPIRSPRSESAPAKRRDRPRPASPRAYPWLRTRSPTRTGWPTRSSG